MLNLVPAFCSDLQRPWLWKGWAVGALLVLGLLGLVIVAASLESQAPTPGLDRVLRKTGLSLTLTGAALVGAFSFTADYRRGSFNRRVLLFQRGAAFTGRATTTTLAALTSGALMGAAFGLSGLFVDGAWHLNLVTVLGFCVTAGMGSLWGFALGSLIRNHLVSLFVVPLSLALPELLSPSIGDTGRLLFPILAANWAENVAVNIPASGSFAGALCWLLVITAVASWVFLRRDLA
ncbi:hypothetical protein ACIQTW_07545 [Paenarthrobacter sp. NPDC090517]|uniref:hypothetical protein n=1 Tax=Paenarthrobacter sp. NPDC090517 TaxID=3364381 RepID=UPI00380F2574